MNNQIVRTVLLAMLFLGCIVLAVPQWSQKIERWLFDSEATSLNEPTSPTKLAAESTRKHLEQHALYTTNADEQNSQTPRAIPLAYEEVVTETHSSQRDFQVQPNSLEQPIKTANADLLRWQQKLEQLGAKYVVVELKEDHYQCRCLMPLSPDSVYEKAFAADDLDPARAMQAVMEQVKIWQTHQAGRSDQNKFRELQR